MVYGGRVEVDVAFNWSKTTSVITRNGSGSAFGLSDMISFAKQISIENGSSYSYDLLDADEVTWNEDSGCLLYTSPSPRDQRGSRMPSSA